MKERWSSYVHFVAHTRNATRTTNMDRMRTRAQEGSEQCACQLECDRVSKTETTAAGTWSQSVKKVRVQPRRAQEGSEQRARRLIGNRERAGERRQRQGQKQCDQQRTGCLCACTRNNVRGHQLLLHVHMHLYYLCCTGGGGYILINKVPTIVYALALIASERSPPRLLTSH